MHCAAPWCAGEGRGSKQTVPTLNLDTPAEVLPKNGVYVTRTRAGTSEWPSITNVGYRPTFDGQARTIETYLLAPLDGAAPEEISVEFLRWVRDERKFENAEALKAQIMRDVNRAQTYFRRRAPGRCCTGAFTAIMRENQDMEEADMSFSEGKVRHMKALSNKQGVIAAAAMDQRGSLQKSIAAAKGVPAEK